EHGRSIHRSRRSDAVAAHGSQFWAAAQLRAQALCRATGGVCLRSWADWFWSARRTGDASLYLRGGGALESAAGTGRTGEDQSTRWAEAFGKFARRTTA